MGPLIHTAFSNPLIFAIFFTLSTSSIRKFWFSWSIHLFFSLLNSFLPFGFQFSSSFVMPFDHHTCLSQLIFLSVSVCSMSFSFKRSILISLFDLKSYSSVCLFFFGIFFLELSAFYRPLLCWPHFTCVYTVLLKLCLIKFSLTILSWMFSAVRNNICFQIESVIVFSYDNYCGYLISIPNIWNFAHIQINKFFF